MLSWLSYLRISLSLSFTCRSFLRGHRSMPKLKNASVSRSVRAGTSSMVMFLPLPVYWWGCNDIVKHWIVSGLKRLTTYFVPVCKLQKLSKSSTWSKRKSANFISSSLMKRVFLCSQSWWDVNVVNILTIIIMDLIGWGCWIALAPGEEEWVPRCPSYPWWLAEGMVVPHTPGIQISTTTIGISS